MDLERYNTESERPVPKLALGVLDKGASGREGHVLSSTEDRGRQAAEGG